MKKMMILSTVFFAALSGLFAAGQGETQETESKPTLEIWHVYADEVHFIDEAIDLWNEGDHDSYIEGKFIPKPELNRELTQGAITGEMPDMTFIDNPDSASFALSGMLLDITDRVNAWDKAKEFFPGPMASGNFEGRQYSIPMDTNTICLYYNKDMFEKAGLTRPPETWKELYEYSEKLTNDAEFVKGIAFCAQKSEEGTFQFLPFVQQSGGTFDNLDSPEAVSALQLWTDLVQNGYASQDVISITQNEAVGLLASENAAMAISGPWSLPFMEKADFDWGLALLPYKEEVGIRASAMGGLNIAISANTAYADQAWSFITWMHEDDNARKLYWEIQKGSRIIPRKDIANTPGMWTEDPGLSVFIEQLQYAKPRGPHQSWPEISAAIQAAFQKSIAGVLEPEDALKEAAEIIDGLK